MVGSLAVIVKILVYVVSYIASHRECYAPENPCFEKKGPKNSAATNYILYVENYFHSHIIENFGIFSYFDEFITL